MKNLLKALFLLSFVALIIHSCETADTENYGTLRMDITDAPFPIDIIDSANVTIVKAEARHKIDTSDAEFIVLSEDTLTFNLLDLRNGVTATMSEVEVPAGEYDLVRLYVDEASLTIKEGETYKVKVPSGSQTGIKVFIDPPVEVTGGLTSELLLDFDLEKSFVLKGNMNTPAGIKGFNFKPVVRAVNNSEAGSLRGTVSDTTGLLLENAAVRVYQDTLVASAITDSVGFYAISGLPAGTYDAEASLENYDTLLIEGIEITAANAEEVIFELTMSETEE